MLLLGAVLFSAVRWGFGPSLFAALLSVGVSSGRRTILLLRSPTGFRLISEPNQKVQLTDDELQTAARWWEGGTAQDRTQCQIGAWTFHRLVRPRGTVGLLGVETLAQSSTASESKQTIELLLEQAAVMIERAAPTGDQKLSGHSSRDNMVSGESS